MAKVFTILASLVMIFSINAQDDTEELDPISAINQAIRKKEYLLAENLCRSELRKHPADNALRLLYSHALIMHSKFSIADSILRKVEEDDTAEAGVEWFRGLSAERQMQDSAAAVHFKSYIRKTKNPLNVNVSALLHIGSAYRRKMHGTGISLGELEDMITHYKLYIEANPTDPYIAMLQEFSEAVKLRKPAEGERLIWDEKE
jgi:hypothetical protein